MANVLVIDDEPDIGTILRTILEDEGHSVIVAENGVEGRQVLEENAIDLVITDVVMPEQGGMELALSIHRSYPNLRWIFVSGKVPVEERVFKSFVQQLSGGQVIAKPFHYRDIVDAVNKALSD